MLLLLLLVNGKWFVGKWFVVVVVVVAAAAAAAVAVAVVLCVLYWFSPAQFGTVKFFSSHIK